MNLAPLQLLDYFVHALHVEALGTYDPAKQQELDLESLEVKESCFPVGEEHPNRFAVDLLIKQPAVEGKNLPYTYELHMLGFVEAHPGFSKENQKRLVEINGPSMLFGSAREILRTATGRGPYGPVMIPSTSFFKEESKPRPKKSKSPAKKPKTEAREFYILCLNPEGGDGGRYVQSKGKSYTFVSKGPFDTFSSAEEAERMVAKLTKRYGDRYRFEVGSV
jgi:preprotein translocase subunit SecB